MFIILFFRSEMQCFDEIDEDCRNSDFIQKVKTAD